LLLTRRNNDSLFKTHIFILKNEATEKMGLSLYFVHMNVGMLAGSLYTFEKPPQPAKSMKTSGAFL